MPPATPLCLVHKQSPGKVAGPVEPDQREALRDYFLRGHESPLLLTFLNHVHETRRWIICDCLEPSTPLDERPALTVARSPKNKLYLRNLISRRNHAEHCPFRYEPAPARERGEPEGNDGPEGLPNGALNLHRATAKDMAGDSPVNNDPRRSVTRKKTYPRLGQVLLHLMQQAGMLDQGPSFDFLEAVRDIRTAAAGLQAYAGTSLDEVLCLSARQEGQLIRQVDESRRLVANAYGLMVVVVHEIERGPLALVRRGRDGSLEWRCVPQGEVKVWARRSISKGPFIAAITYAPGAGKTEVCPQHAFVLPILGNTRPMPVESDLERRVAGSLLRLAEWAKKAKGALLYVSKPMHDIDVQNGQCRPDFLVRGPGGQAVVEVMGMVDDPEYVARKERTHPLMRELGGLIEVGPDIDNQVLRGMNSEVFKGVVPRSAVRSRYREV
jgi:hypothetical protein